MAVIISIAGGTGSGKTTLASGLARALNAPILAMDDYYHPLDHLTFEERCLVNFDEPAAIDHRLLHEHLQMLRKGNSIEKPVYDFTRHTRKPIPELFSASRFVVMEGIFAIHWPEINAQASARVFVEAPQEERFQRRLARDVRERARTRDEVHERFHSHVVPMHERFVEPSKVNADMIVLGTEPIQSLVDCVLVHISRPAVSLR